MSRILARGSRLGLAAGLLAAGLATAWVGNGGPSRAGAHGEVVASEPAPGAELEAAPVEVRIDLGVPLAPESSITVMDEGFREVMAGPTVLDSEHPERMAVPLAALAPGAYTVQWKARDAEDGHWTEGSYVFHLRPGGGLLAGSPLSGLAVFVGLPLLVLAGLVLVLGWRWRGGAKGSRVG